MIGFGLWGFWQRHQTTNNPDPTIPTEVVTHSTDRPDETPPKCDDSYTVPADQPRKIELPSLSVSGCIQPVGVDQENKIAVPTNIHVAGWFVDSVLPGDQGVSIIDGHVQGRYTEGIFKRLDELRPGDEVIVEFGDLSRQEFEAVSIGSYTVEQTSIEQYKALDGAERQLTLITCGGNYDPATQSYDQRTIVRAKSLR